MKSKKNKTDNITNHQAQTGMAMRGNDGTGMTGMYSQHRYHEKHVGQQHR